MKKTEDESIAEVIRSARKIQEFLWSEMNNGCGLEEIKRMFRKRTEKIEDISMDNPHWKIEAKKRLLQTAAIAVNMITKIDNDEITHDGIHPTLNTNLEKYSRPIPKNIVKDQKKELEVESHCENFDGACSQAHYIASQMFENISFDFLHIKFISFESISENSSRKFVYKFEAWVERQKLVKKSKSNYIKDDFWT